MSDLVNLTRDDIAQSIRHHIGLPRSDCRMMVDAITRLIGEALERGENVKITNFGTFTLCDKGQRMGRNPRTGVEVRIEPRRVLTFRASGQLRDAVA